MRSIVTHSTVDPATSTRSSTVHTNWRGTSTEGYTRADFCNFWSAGGLSSRTLALRPWRWRSQFAMTDRDATLRAGADGLGSEGMLSCSDSLPSLPDEAFSVASSSDAASSESELCSIDSSLLSSPRATESVSVVFLTTGSRGSIVSKQRGRGRRPRRQQPHQGCQSRADHCVEFV